ncbi:hypothetical protein KP509_30G011900 [Ceratopteris richardii]|uniref:Uncharacterized protein n=1 Tax=Ceratopteris richardii TaxID=49495 RepID=A0A8T2R1B6_CERRI|nr:hypothetical protein KP509_30G011900 [Ceratopteris richardii]
MRPGFKKKGASYTLSYDSPLGISSRTQPSLQRFAFGCCCFPAIMASLGSALRSFILCAVISTMILQSSAQGDGPVVFPITCSHPVVDGKQVSVKCPFVAGSTTQRNDTVCRPLCTNPDVVGRCKGSTCRCCTTGV